MFALITTILLVLNTFLDVFFMFTSKVPINYAGITYTFIITFSAAQGSKCRSKITVRWRIKMPLEDQSALEESYAFRGSKCYSVIKMPLYDQSASQGPKCCSKIKVARGSKCCSRLTALLENQNAARRSTWSVQVGSRIKMPFQD